jgi:hypothetical protein
VEVLNGTLHTRPGTQAQIPLHKLSLAALLSLHKTMPGGPLFNNSIPATTP